MNGNPINQIRTSNLPWIKQFCQAQPILVEIDKIFIEDSFNLYGLKQMINDFMNAMNIILDKKCNSSFILFICCLFVICYFIYCYLLYLLL